MRNHYDAAWPQEGLGLGRALTAAVAYAAGMLTLAALITLAADGLARTAVPAAMAVLEAPAGSRGQTDLLQSKGASNAAIMAALEARPALLGAAAPVTRQPAVPVTTSLSQRRANATQ